MGLGREAGSHPNTFNQHLSQNLGPEQMFSALGYGIFSQVAIRGYLPLSVQCRTGFDPGMRHGSSRAPRLPYELAPARFTCIFLKTRFTFGEQMLFRIGKDIAGPVTIRGYNVIWVGEEMRVLTQIPPINT